MADRRRSSDLSISDYLQAARFHPWAVVLPMVVIGVLAWLLLGRGATVYEAEAEVIFGTTAAQDSVDTADKDRVNDANFKANEIKRAKGDVIVSEVMDRLGSDAPDDADDLDIEITADAEADILVFTAKDDTSQGAADLANIYAEVYVEKARENAVASYTDTIESIESELQDIRNTRLEARSELDEVIVELAGTDEDDNARPRLLTEEARLLAELGPQLTSLDTQETVLIDQLSTLRINQTLAQSGTAQISSLAVPDPNPLPSAGTRALIVGEIVGLILGLMLAVTLENMNDRLREPSDVEKAFPDLPILGTVPYESSVRKRRELTVLAQPNSNFSESIYQVRTSLKFMTMEQGVRLVVVTSSQPSEGKTTFTSNFAWALAGLNDKVVLIDGDLRRPVAHQHFGVDLAPGLTDLVIDKRPIESVEVSFEEQQGNFSFIPAGTNHGNAADFLGSSHVVDRVKQIAEDSVTVVDAAPVLPVSDARALAGASDLTIMMVRVGSSRRSEVAAAIQNLRNAGAGSIALVLVGVKAETSAYYGDQERTRTTSGTAHPTPVRLMPQNNRPNAVQPAQTATPAAVSAPPVSTVRSAPSSPAQATNAPMPAQPTIEARPVGDSTGVRTQRRDPAAPPAKSNGNNSGNGSAAGNGSSAGNGNSAGKSNGTSAGTNKGTPPQKASQAPSEPPKKRPPADAKAAPAKPAKGKPADRGKSTSIFDASSSTDSSQSKPPRGPKRPPRSK